MTKNLDKKVTARNQGAASQHLMKMFDPVLEDEKKTIIEQMKADVRGGTATEMSLFTSISKLICLEDLRGRFESRIKSGHRAAQEINNG